MPHETRVRSEFAQAVLEALGGRSANQASYKTEVSNEWIRKMTHGRVPSEAILARFARGLDADLENLRIAAGYLPDDPVKIVEIAAKNAGVSEEDQNILLTLMQDMLARSKKGEQTEGQEAGSEKK